MFKIVKLAGVAFGSGVDAEERARKTAERKFDDLCSEFGQRVGKSTHGALRELYQDRCFIAYLICVEVDLNDTDLLKWANAKSILADLEGIEGYSFHVSLGQTTT